MLVATVPGRRDNAPMRRRYPAFLLLLLLRLLVRLGHLWLQSMLLLLKLHRYHL